MAIQISDKLLSEKARKALNNANNKSQFLRDAIEFYVNSIDPSNTDDFSLHGKLMENIEELKAMISNIAANGNVVIPNSVFNSDNQTGKVGDNVIVRESAITNDSKKDTGIHSEIIEPDTNAEILASVNIKEGEISLDKNDFHSDVNEEEIPNCFAD